jgi:ubiquitin C-terminal hydrolase
MKFCRPLHATVWVFVRCKNVYYCSVACQRKDWKLGHSVRCGDYKNNETQSNDGPDIELPDNYLVDPFFVRQYFKISNNASKTTNVPVGFRNLGNTCFVNSILQALLASSVFRNYLSEGNHTQHCTIESKQMQRKSNMPKVCVLCVLSRLTALTEGGSAVVAPEEMVGCAPVLDPAFRVGRQQDAHELLKGLLLNMQAISHAYNDTICITCRQLRY